VTYFPGVLSRQKQHRFIPSLKDRRIGAAMNKLLDLREQFAGFSSGFSR
jgi:hypothetical protein